MVYKFLNKEKTASILAAFALFLVAALFSIGILLAFFDYGTLSPEQQGFLSALGHVVVGAFGLSSLLIPVFFFVSGAFCLDYRWSVQRAMCLLVSFVPFFTVVGAEKWIRSVVENYSGAFAVVAVVGITAFASFMVIAEYLVTLVFASLLEAKYAKNHKKYKAYAQTKEAHAYTGQPSVDQGQKEAEYDQIELDDQFEDPSVAPGSYGKDSQRASVDEFIRNSANKIRNIARLEDRSKHQEAARHASDEDVDLDDFFGTRKKKEDATVVGDESEEVTEFDDDIDVADGYEYDDADSVDPDDINPDDFEYPEEETGAKVIRVDDAAAAQTVEAFAETVDQNAQTVSQNGQPAEQENQTASAKKEDIEKDGDFYTPSKDGGKPEKVFVKRVIVSDDAGIPLSMEESVDKLGEDEPIAGKATKEASADETGFDDEDDLLAELAETDVQEQNGQDEEDEAEVVGTSSEEAAKDESTFFEFDPSLEKKGTFIKEARDEEEIVPQPHQTQDVVHNLTPSRKGRALLSALDDVFAKMDDDVRAQVEEDGIVTDEDSQPDEEEKSELSSTSNGFAEAEDSSIAKNNRRNLAAEIDSAENESDIEDLDKMFDASQDSEYFDQNQDEEDEDDLSDEDEYGDDSLEDIEDDADRETFVEEDEAKETPVFANSSLPTDRAIVTDEYGSRPISIPQPKRHKAGPYLIPTDLLTAYADNPYWIIDEETQAAARNLEGTLDEFKIKAEVTGIRKGPVVTMFEMLPAPGVKLSKIVALQDNIALRLAASSVRIVAPIPGKRAVGIEVPNKERSIVSFRECIEQDRPEWKKMAVPVILGKDIQGETQIIDLVKTPHLLIAGSTGAGKSVCVNSMILSMLYKRGPNDVKMILIDPKIVELKLYNDIPHLLTPVITEPKKALQALQYCLCEMERRYELLNGMEVRDISTYNKKIAERHIATEKLPYLIVVIDEFADLMATTGKQLEAVIARLAAMSRAVGIHLVLATQRPSIDVITGLIKANIPSRIAFMVASKTDSRIIIDQVGAEKLLGKGDMLYASATDPFPKRIQGTFVSDQEVENVVGAVKEWGEPEYIDDEIFVDDDDEDDGQMSLFGEEGEDPLYEKALDIVVQAGKASASYIQRRLKIGYNRAARLVEQMEERGIVGPANGSKPREVIHIP